MEPLIAQIADVEEDIESIVRRNEVVDEEYEGIKTDILSLSDKILAIKVSFFQNLFPEGEFHSFSRSFCLGKYQWNDHFWRDVPRIPSTGLPAKWNVLHSTRCFK